MNWKVGDKFLSLKTISKTTRIKGNFYEVVRAHEEGSFRYKGESGIYLNYYPETILKVEVLINPLNKKLYPNYVEYKDHLIPKKAYEKLVKDANE